jgi:hypothetical protein
MHLSAAIPQIELVSSSEHGVEVQERVERYCKKANFRVKNIRNGDQGLLRPKSDCHPDHRDFALGL